MNVQRCWDMAIRVEAARFNALRRYGKQIGHADWLICHATNYDIKSGVETIDPLECCLMDEKGTSGRDRTWGGGNKGDIKTPQRRYEEETKTMYFSCPKGCNKIIYISIG